MSDCMIFPEDWHDFLKDYSFDDSEEVYTNGSRLIQVYRVEQLIEHLLEAQTPHVMTLEEVKECDYCWLETSWPDRDEFLPVLWIPSDNEDVVVCFTNGRNCDYACDTDTYNIDWRCWNTRPTEEQRKAVAWIEA